MQKSAAQSHARCPQTKRAAGFCQAQGSRYAAPLGRVTGEKYRQPQRPNVSAVWGRWAACPWGGRRVFRGEGGDDRGGWAGVAGGRGRDEGEMPRAGAEASAGLSGGKRWSARWVGDGARGRTEIGGGETKKVQRQPRQPLDSAAQKKPQLDPQTQLGLKATNMSAK